MENVSEKAMNFCFKVRRMLLKAITESMLLHRDAQKVQGWDDRQAVENIFDVKKKIQIDQNEQSFDPYLLSNRQLKTLGFMSWQRDGQMFYIIPQYLLPYIKPDTQLYTYPGLKTELFNPDNIVSRSGCIRGYCLVKKL